MGHHCDVYSGPHELIATNPKHGMILARDDEGQGSACKVLHQLSLAGIWLPVVATLMNPQPGRVVSAIECGALDYLRLPFDLRHFRETIARISDEAEAFGGARRKIIEARSRIASLSPREREVLDWLV